MSEEFLESTRGFFGFLNFDLENGLALTEKLRGSRPSPGQHGPPLASGRGYDTMQLRSYRRMQVLSEAARSR